MKTILLGLNELNFNFIKNYSEKNLLPNFKKLFDNYTIKETISENEYELLEPWIQWVTVHTGKEYKNHKIFRLGDIANSKENQIFESLEGKGLKIGAVSPFNASNKLKSPAFFIPDPWTKTKVSGNWIIKALYQAIHQSVNDNASGKLSLKSLISLGIGSIIFIPINKYKYYLNYLINRKKPGVKAVILDALLGDAFLYLVKKKKPDFSTLFLNSGAHIQHHYLFNSKAYDGKFKNPDWYCEKGYDPLLKILKQYDLILGELLSKEINLFVCTGLHQQPHMKLTFYWRVNKHTEFLNKLNIAGIKDVMPRMSRDFLIEFTSDKAALNAENLLNSIVMDRDNEKVFKIDNRGSSLFIELIYSKEITQQDSISSKENDLIIKQFKSFISFVAIKNGEHNGLGYFAYKQENVKTRVPNNLPLKEVRGIIEESVLQNYNLPFN